MSQEESGGITLAILQGHSLKRIFRLVVIMVYTDFKNYYKKFGGMTESLMIFNFLNFLRLDSQSYRLKCH